ncbi:MAG: hypothetical protein MJ006_01885 [Methanocorpusculum sp.]|nr:hypothetical protein [Methanocorpusculum sp.]
MTEHTEEIPQTPPENPGETEEKITNLHRNKTPPQPPVQTHVQDSVEKPVQTSGETAARPPAESRPASEPASKPSSKSQFIDVPSLYEETEEKDGIYIRFYPPEHCRSYPIYKSYSMRVIRGLFRRAGEGEIFDTEIGAYYELFHEGISEGSYFVQTLFDYNIPELSILDRFREHVAKREGIPEEMLIKPPEKELPPWERTKPVRKIEAVREADKKPALKSVSGTGRDSESESDLLDDLLKDPVSKSIFHAKCSLNERGYAERFAEECRGWLVYDTPAKKWYAWEKSHWEPAGERLGKAKLFVAQTLQLEKIKWELEMTAERKRALENGNTQLLKEISALLSAYDQNITASQQTKGLDTMEKIAAESMLCIDLQEAAAHEILTFQNGGVDCVTGKYYSLEELERNKEKYPVHYIDREYDEKNIPVHFEEHLRNIFTDNTTEGLSERERLRRAEILSGYFKRLLGYALTPGNARNLFVFLWGAGANGKSTTIDAIKAAIPSEIATVNSKELFTTQQEKPTPGLFKGLTRRIVYFAEMSGTKGFGGGKVSAENLKVLSGEKEVNTRTLNREDVTQKNLCLPIAATNNFPSFDAEPDKALLRRIITIPFMHEFTDADRRTDMGDLLAREGDAIFSMMITELRAYLAAEIKQHGSGLPGLPAFCREKQTEFVSGDAQKAFVAENLEHPEEGEDVRVFFDEIKGRYMYWCVDRGIPVVTREEKRLRKERDAGSEERSVLSKGESQKLKNALMSAGFRSGSTYGKPYYFARWKRD